MESVHDIPSRNTAPDDPNAKAEWMKAEIGVIVDSCVAPSLQATLDALHTDTSDANTQDANTQDANTQDVNHGMYNYTSKMSYVHALIFQSKHGWCSIPGVIQ